MRVVVLFCISFSLLNFSSCQTEISPDNNNDNNNSTEKPKEGEQSMPLPINVGKIFVENGKKFMFGGEDSTWNFDITNGVLIDSQYHYGIGREAFYALIEPQFISLEEADRVFADSSNFLFLQIGNDKRAYSIELLTHHEIVNDVVDGKPIMAAYCVLADLGAIYDRTYGDTTLTFALSSYTYYDPEVWNGTDGFVFWDRETESTWWPLIGKGISGDMLDVPLKEYNEENWSKMTWEEIKNTYSDVKVLKPDQSMAAPETWVKYDSVTIAKIKNDK